ncbi:hypothetical protein PVK06_002120 [Gossypium arboreum]|uniref:Uncharacterized protein n=1 Tax=Gossypium arboreum TaxID=29729 RepID=A0ABR0R2S9_GOSAR|nr:hypothetical protein PVK06_002120 [Gossypium arboreum]
MTSTGERTSNMADVRESKNENGNGFYVDPPREPSVDGSEVVLFSEPEPVPTEQEDDDELEFAELPHIRPGHANPSLDSGDLEVGKEFFNKYGFLAELK